MNPKKILIIRIDRLGDLVLSTPFIRAVKENFPESYVACMVRSYTKEVLENNPFVDEVIVYEEARHKEILKKVKYANFDWTVALSPLFKAYWLALLTGSSFKTGMVYSTRPLSRLFAGLFFNKFLTLKIDEALKKGEKIPHEVEQMLSLADFLSLKVKSNDLVFNLTDVEKMAGKNLLDYRRGLGEEFFIGLHLSHKWIASDFTVNNLTDFIYEIQKEFPKAGLVLTYGLQDIDIISQIKKDKNIRDLLIGALSIRQWASLISQFKLFITMDTGSTHIASAFGMPIVCVYDDKQFNLCSLQWSPWKCRHVNLKRSQLKRLNGSDWDTIKKLV